MADRRQREPTAKVSLVPDERRSEQSTEQIDAVVPMPDRTVTVTVRSEVEELQEGVQRATLVLVAGPAPGQVYSLGAKTVIGRDVDVDIRLEDPAVSRRHARLTTQGSGYVIEDLGSANGTLVGGAKISRRDLADGDRIQLGPRVVMRFALLDEHEERMHRQLFESSTRDPLTNAYNKGYVTERLLAEVAHARRHRSSLEVVMLDLDRFKQINDKHGHLVGDNVLRAVADRVHALIRSEDVFGRFGGEEFVVLTRGSDAHKLAERIRASIELLAIPVEGIELRLTVSLGVARLDELPEEATASHLLDAADRRLLRAKQAGRNQSCARG